MNEVELRSDGFGDRSLKFGWTDPSACSGWAASALRLAQGGETTGERPTGLQLGEVGMKKPAGRETGGFVVVKFGGFAVLRRA